MKRVKSLDMFFIWNSREHHWRYLLKSSSAGIERPSSSATRGSPPAACGKLDGVGVWFVNGVAAAFFASLERCSCIRIATEDDGEDANDVPLIQSDGNVRHLAGTTSRKRTRKGNNKQG
ncbi:hypothetical protein GOBAR_AA23684 [Gossypium barbadense]|uniref:Uncharacterized protein n=1 Tax=Gossypium barbadense TaxID=3634 RepID=A0A2P5X0Y0_GOSBA|nr:hypothetical protein GOBAR_AA23684 [Gossypium barbadense]